MDTASLRTPQIKSKEPVKTCYFFLYRISGQIKKLPQGELERMKRERCYLCPIQF